LYEEIVGFGIGQFRWMLATSPGDLKAGISSSRCCAVGKPGLKFHVEPEPVLRYPGGLGMRPL
jgi:hypothetical protein